ncbi:MAG: type II toxin-antitoxin system VapC family toxin [Caldilineales bacterium]|nr:type II toxin-antitoxin system VapC family toxin [Caldilineales bacterium]
MSPEANVYILDSFALLAYLEDEAGAEQVEARLAQAEQGEAQVLLPLINFGECLYIVERERGVAQAEWMIALMDHLPIQVVGADRSLVFAAAHIKARYPIAYADAFAVAVARQVGGTLLTGDPAFRQVQNLISIEWLPQRR